MNSELRFQAMILPNLGWPELLARFQNAEDLGFDLASTGDHFCDWSSPPSEWFEMWSVLAGVAQATERIRIAPCVAQIPLRNPAMFARQALTVDHISGGRLEVGLGLGLPIDPSYEMIGMENWSNPKRVAHFTEYVEIVDQMLSNEVTTYEGEHYQVVGATMNPRSPQNPRPPITVAALGPIMVRKAVVHADTWNTMSFAESFDDQLAETKVRIDGALAHCDKIDRDPATLRISYNMFDPGSRASGGRISYYESPEAFADQAGQLLELGITELSMYYPMLADQLPVFDTIAREVFPQIRAEHAEN
ncbi:MAG: alkanesulfonate monooxygenase SsuD [Verrucomicrobiales bacterium]|jgi:alkanesulfonate monooxygenase SsuD/methylene tetrahydromethanopterin reductase-like flavin-dependent oxidoreductase (luciferase family)